MSYIMTAEKLNEHKVNAYGRNYAESTDGYEDMTAENKRGWSEVSGWGRDGWDLGQWPYVVIYTQDFNAGTPAASYGLMQICEGDRTVYAFTSAEDREAAINYLFLWYSADQRWSPLTWEQREALDAGTVEVDPKYLGPFSWERCDREREQAAQDDSKEQS